MADGRSILADLGEKKFPVGTLEELKEHGLNPLKVASCSPEIRDQTRGCPYWEDCRFDHKSMGGFKGDGPRYVAYRIINPALGELGTNQGCHACYSWVRLQNRADFGAAARRASGGKKGEVIRVIAQEGEQYEVRENLPINGKGEVVQPMPEMIEDLKANNIKYSLLPGEVSIGRRDFILKRIVPRFKRLGEINTDGGFAQRLAMLDMEADEATRTSIDYGASAPLSKEADAEENPFPTATPVKRGPGRPKKEPDA